MFLWVVASNFSRRSFGKEKISHPDASSLTELFPGQPHCASSRYTDLQYNPMHAYVDVLGTDCWLSVHRIVSFSILTLPADARIVS